MPKNLYRPHADSVKANASVQRNEYGHGTSDRQPTIPSAKAQSKPHDNRDTISHPSAYLPSDRTKPTLFNPLQPHADKARFHMTHQSFDDLYQRSSTMSPLQNQYSQVPANSAGHEPTTAAVQITHTKKPLQRHFETFALGGNGGGSGSGNDGKMSTPLPIEPRQSNDLTNYPRSHSANLFYHEQNRIKPIRDLPSTSNNLMNAYNYATLNSAKPHDYYYQANTAQPKWSNQTRITQSPITTAPSPHSLSGQIVDAMSHSPISASPLPYPMHRQNPSVTIHKSNEFLMIFFLFIAN